MATAACDESESVVTGFIAGGILMRTFELKLDTRFGRFRQKLLLKYSDGKQKKE